MAGNKKKEIVNIAQDNLHMLKRLTEKTSCYNFERWEKDYDKQQKYKRLHCIYPSIDFYKTQRAETFGNKFPMLKNGWYKSKTSYGLFENKKKKTFENFNYKDLESASNKNKNHVKTLETEKNEEKKEKKEENKESKEIGGSRKDEKINNNEKEENKESNEIGGSRKDEKINDNEKEENEESNEIGESSKDKKINDNEKKEKGGKLERKNTEDQLF